MGIDKLAEASGKYDAASEKHEAASDDWFNSVVAQWPAKKAPPVKKRVTRPFVRWGIVSKKQASAGKIFQALRSLKGRQPGSGGVTIDRPDHDGDFAGGRITGAVLFPIGSSMTDPAVQKAVSIIKRHGGKVLNRDLVTFREDDGDLVSSRLTKAELKRLKNLKKQGGDFSFGDPKLDVTNQFYYASIYERSAGTVMMIRAYTRLAVKKRVQQAKAILNK